MNESWLLTWLLLLPLVGGVAVLALPVKRALLVRRVGLAFVLATSLVAHLAAAKFDWHRAAPYEKGAQLITDALWFPSLNIHFSLGVDGISLPLVLLTSTISLLACWASYGIEKRVKAYFALFLFLEAALLGILTALDLVLFYVFFELALIPVYFLIAIWGGPRKEHAAIKLFLCALPGTIAGLLIIGLHSFTTQAKGHPEFNLLTLATDTQITSLFNPTTRESPPMLTLQVSSTTAAPLSPPAANPAPPGMKPTAFAALAFWLLFLAFALRLPAVPLHTWLPDALVEAPTPISMLLSAGLLTTGGYGLLRVAYPLFPHQAVHFWQWVALIGIVTILYGALCALAQKDFKRLVAYSSLSQTGYVLLGLAMMTPTALTGALFQLISHGITFAMLFFAIGVIHDRAHHSEIRRLGGLFGQMPAYSGWAALALLSALGLPGLSGFVGQLLVLLGTFTAATPGSSILAAGASQQIIITLGILTAAATILTAAYLLWTLQRVYMGPPRGENSHFAPIMWREILILAFLGLAAIAWGTFPGQLLLTPIKPAMESLMAAMGIRI